MYVDVGLYTTIHYLRRCHSVRHAHMVRDYYYYDDDDGTGGTGQGGCEKKIERIQ